MPSDRLSELTLAAGRGLVPASTVISLSLHPFVTRYHSSSRDQTLKPASIFHRRLFVAKFLLRLDDARSLAPDNFSLTYTSVE
jgi:hypothetical protein